MKFYSVAQLTEYVNSLRIGGAITFIANENINNEERLQMIDCPLCKKENIKKANKQKYKAYVNTEGNTITCDNPKCKLYPHINKEEKRIVIPKTMDFIQIMTNEHRITENIELINHMYKTDIEPLENYRVVDYKSIIPKSPKEDIELTVERYVSEQNNNLLDMIKENKHILLNAPTGFGKTSAMMNILDKLDTSVIIFTVPYRSIAEGVEKDYNKLGYQLFYGEMTTDKINLSTKKNKPTKIVCTYNKCGQLINWLDNLKDGILTPIDLDNLFGTESLNLDRSFAKNWKGYTLVVDETHALIQSRGLLNSNDKLNAIKVEQLEAKAKYSIFMSANTDEFKVAWDKTQEAKYNNDKKYLTNIKKRTDNIYKKGTKYKTYEDENGIKAEFKDLHYIKIVSEKENFSANNLDIYRVPRMEKENIKDGYSIEDYRVSVICNIIKDSLKNHQHAIFTENNINRLNNYKEGLIKLGFDEKEVVVIDSNSKQCIEEVKNTYEAIINDGKLIVKVVLTTSTINSGVNITEAKNVATIVYQNKNTFNSCLLEQFFGRIRTEGEEWQKNDNILILDSSENEYFGTAISFEKEYRRLKDKAQEKAEEVVTLYQKNRLFDENDNSMEKIFNVIKWNDGFNEIRDCLYIGTKDIIDIDIKQIVSKSMSIVEKELYYDDNYIAYVCRNVKARTKNIPVSYDITDLEYVKVDKKERLPIHTYMNDILKDTEAKAEFENYLTENKTFNKIENELVKNVIIDCSSQLKLLKKDLKTLNIIDIYKENFNNIPDQRTYYDMIYNKYTTERSNKEIEAHSLSLKYSIYNVRYNNLNNVKERISTDINNPTYTQDIYYSTIRNSLDNIAKNRRKVTDNQINNIAESIISQQGYKQTTIYCYDTNQQETYFVKGDNTDKKLANDYLKQITDNVRRTISMIYHVGNTGRLNGLNIFSMQNDDK
ncbi:DEAD/DEAH box helicase [Clostridium butyricum]